MDTAMNADSTGPLAGVRVLELAGIGPIRLGCMLLADLGAEVVRIERPGGQWGFDTADVDRLIADGVVRQPEPAHIRERT
jgi:crotonobetainyl-CoA:carnitine CoA-transferase CaiB-like acyl-CoA transferase